VPWAYGFGAVLIALQVIVISTHFCLASWMYEKLMSILGQWSAPLPVEQVKALVGEGAQLIDVRDPDEFQQGHLEGAINIPVGEMGKHTDELQDGAVVLYCKSGLRSQEALQLMKREGCEKVYNLGPMARWVG